MVKKLTKTQLKRALSVFDINNNGNDDYDKNYVVEKKKMNLASKGRKDVHQNKKMKASNRDEDRKNNYDKVPQNVSGIHEFPRRYREMLIFQEQRKKKKEQQQNLASSSLSSSKKHKNENSSSSLVQNSIIMPGESLKQFNIRVNKLAQDEINKKSREMTKTKLKHKLALKAKKEKLKSKKRMQMDKNGDNDNSILSDFKKLNDRKKIVEQQLPFYVQAEAPPTFNALPKNRPAPASLKKLSGVNDQTNVNQHGPKSLLEAKFIKNHDPDQPSSSPSSLFGSKTEKSIAEQRIINAEREKVIAAYRLQKQRQIQLNQLKSSMNSLS